MTRTLPARLWARPKNSFRSWLPPFAEYGTYFSAKGLRIECVDDLTCRASSYEIHICVVPCCDLGVRLDVRPRPGSLLGGEKPPVVVEPLRPVAIAQPDFVVGNGSPASVNLEVLRGAEPRRNDRLQHRGEAGHPSRHEDPDPAGQCPPHGDRRRRPGDARWHGTQPDPDQGLENDPHRPATQVRRRPWRPKRGRRSKSRTGTAGWGSSTASSRTARPPKPGRTSAAGQSGPLGRSTFLSRAASFTTAPAPTAGPFAASAANSPSSTAPSPTARPSAMAAAWMPGPKARGWAGSAGQSTWTASARTARNRGCTSANACSATTRPATMAEQSSLSRTRKPRT